MNSGGFASDLRHGSQRSHSVEVFRHFHRALPDIVSSQVHVLPAKRREMGEQMIRHILDLAQGGDSPLKIPCVPEDDRGDNEVQAGGPVLLVFIGSVADFAEPMDEDRPGQTVAGLAFIEFLAGLAAQFRITSQDVV